MLVDRGGFWYRVLAERYGEEAWRLGAEVVLIGGGRWLGLEMAQVRRRWVVFRDGVAKGEMGHKLFFGMIGG
jgi:hypothetical protein